MQEWLQQRGALLQAGHSMQHARCRADRHPKHLPPGRGMPQASVDMVQLAAYRRARAGMRDAASRLPAASPVPPAASRQQGWVESPGEAFCDLSPTCLRELQEKEGGRLLIWAIK